MRLPPGLCPGPRWGGLQRPPDGKGCVTHLYASPHILIRIDALGRTNYKHLPAGLIDNLTDDFKSRLNG